jgi:site-specific recombinase
MLALLEHIAQLERRDGTDTGVGADSIALLVALFDTVRPRRHRDGAAATANVRTLCQLLHGEPRQAAALRAYLLRLLEARRHTSLYTDIGVLSNDGFFSELKRRISYRLLPPALGDDYLSDLLDQVVWRKTDYLWIAAVPAADWLALFDAIAGTGAPSVIDAGAAHAHIALDGLLEAIRTLSYRVCAIGLEPKLTTFHTDIENYDSPFLMQNVEVNAYLDAYARLLAGQSDGSGDARHLLVMLDQCDVVVAKIRRNAIHLGTSIALTYLLVALTQSIDRLRKLLFLVDLTGELPAAPTVDLAALAAPTAPIGPARLDQRDGPVSQRRAAAVALALELVEAHNKKYDVRDLFTDNIDLLARNVTENASRTGEHYIAESRRELRGMFASSAGAGFIIGFMALIKILMSYLRAAPLVEAFLYSLNYSVGFMFIHVLHCTVATKQPAMTASRIAAGLHSRDGRHIDLDSMAELINKVLRTQCVAVLGNLATALPTAYAIAIGYAALFGHNLVTPDKARHLLADIDPIGGLALMYAMIAGICLFLSGLISGYYDNQALYTRLARRIGQLRGLRRLLGQRRLDRFAVYMENNLGGLMGNMVFGIMLGTIGMVGYGLGLPIDIRHVTFSAANFSTALVGLDNHMSWQLACRSLAGVLLIGAVNLAVSFGLALWVALRARQVQFRHGFALMRALGRRFASAPLDFFIGERDALPADGVAGAVAGAGAGVATATPSSRKDAL